jgi:hypothetical protein
MSEQVISLNRLMPFVLMHHENKGAAQSQYAAARAALIAHPLAFAGKENNLLWRW